MQKIKTLNSLLLKYSTCIKEKLGTENSILDSICSILGNEDYTYVYTSLMSKPIKLQEFADFYSLPRAYVYACYEVFGGDTDNYFLYSGRDCIFHNGKQNDKREFGSRYRIPLALLDGLERTNYRDYMSMITAYAKKNRVEFGTLGDMSIDTSTEAYADDTEGTGRSKATRREIFDTLLGEIHKSKITPLLRRQLDAVGKNDDGPISAAQARSQ